MSYQDPTADLLWHDLAAEKAELNPILECCEIGFHHIFQLASRILCAVDEIAMDDSSALGFLNREHSTVVFVLNQLLFIVDVKM